MTAKPQISRPWRTNVGLRLSRDLGEWFAHECKKTNRTYSNYLETLLIEERARLTNESDAKREHRKSN